MLRTARGFTIVEVLIIISVMGILATIGLVSWGGVSANSRDQAREQDMKQWSTTFDLYKSRYIVYPILPTSAASSPLITCLGTFASSFNKCGQYNSSSSYSDSTASSLLSEVKKLSDRVPVNNGPVVSNLFAGPIVYVSKNTDTPPVLLSAEIVNFFELRCPTGTNWSEVTATSPYSALKTGITDGTKICKLHKELTYNPN